MSKILLALLCLASSVASATEAEICDIRAAILESVAQERDNGVSKKEVMRKLGKEWAGLRGYVDTVYSKTKGMTPAQVGEIVKISCLRE